MLRVEFEPVTLGSLQSDQEISKASTEVLKKTKLHGLSPRANYTDRAKATCQRSDCKLFADRRCHVVSVTDPYGRILGFIDKSRYFSIK
jgi:hypothetical protein